MVSRLGLNARNLPGALKFAVFDRVRVLYSKSLFIFLCQEKHQKISLNHHWDWF
jgi:hypothetical protein